MEYQRTIFWDLKHSMVGAFITQLCIALYYFNLNVLDRYMLCILVVLFILKYVYNIYVCEQEFVVHIKISL